MNLIQLVLNALLARTKDITHCLLVASSEIVLNKNNVKGTLHQILNILSEFFPDLVESL